LVETLELPLVANQQQDIPKVQITDLAANQK
jgi:hypothetical protein